jgi:hypothetical protein
VRCGKDERLFGHFDAVAGLGHRSGGELERGEVFS